MYAITTSCKPGCTPTLGHVEGCPSFVATAGGQSQIFAGPVYAIPNLLCPSCGAGICLTALPMPAPSPENAGAVFTVVPALPRRT